MREQVQDKKPTESQMFFKGTASLEKIAGWTWGKEVLKLTGQELLLAADKLLEEANSIYPPESLGTNGSSDIYLGLAFATSKDGSSRDKFFQEQADREYESSRELDNKKINTNEKREIDGFNRHVLHGIKFVTSYVRPVFNKLINAIDGNKFSKVARLQGGSFVDFLEDPKAFSSYIAALHERWQRRQAYLTAINDQNGAYQKLLSLRSVGTDQNSAYQKLRSLFGAENNVSQENLKQKLDTLQAKAEQIRAASEELDKLKDLIDAAEVLIKKRQAWHPTDSDTSYIASERSKEQNETIRKKAEAMSSMSLRDVISKPDIDENLRLAIVNDKLADDIDSPDPEELTEALDLAVKHDRKNIYLRLLKEGARHSEKYLKDLECLKNLNRIKTMPLPPAADIVSTQPPSQPDSPSFSDSGNGSVGADSNRPITSEPSLPRPVSPSLSDSDRELVISRSVTPGKRKLKKGRAVTIEDPVPKSNALSEVGEGKLSLGGELVDAQRQQRPDTPSFVDSYSEAISRSVTPETSAEGSDDEFFIVPSKPLEHRDLPKALPEVGKGKPSFGSVVWAWITAPFRALWRLFTAPFRKEKSFPAVVAVKPTDEALGKVVLVNTHSQDDALNKVSVEESLSENLSKTVSKPTDQVSGEGMLVDVQLPDLPPKNLSVKNNLVGDFPNPVIEPAGQASDKGVLANAQPQPSETPEPRGESKALPKVRKSKSSFGSVARSLITKVKKVLGKESQGNALPKAANQPPDDKVLGNVPPKNVPSNEMSLEEQKINARLALIPEEDRAKMLKYDAIGKEYLRELEKSAETERQQRVLEEKATAVRVLAEVWQEQAKAQDKQAARSLRSPMSQSGFNLERSVNVPAQTIQSVREVKPTAENKQQTISLSSTHSSMHLNTTRQEIQSVMKIDAKASAEEVMQSFLDHAMRIYLGHPESYLAYRHNKDAETFVNEFIPDARRGNAFKELFKALIAPGSFRAVPGFDNYLENFSTYMDVFASEIRTRKVVVTVLHGEEKRHKYREYKLAAVLAFLFGKRLLEETYGGSNKIPSEKLGQLMLAMAQHFYDNPALYKGGKGLGSYYPYMDLMAKKALELMPEPAKAEDVVENVSEQRKGPSPLSDKAGGW